MVGCGGPEMGVRSISVCGGPGIGIESFCGNGGYRMCGYGLGWM